MVYALWPRNDAAPTAQPMDSPGLGQRAPGTDERRAVDTPEALAPLRQDAGLAGCPTPSGTSAGPLTGITLECIGDGSYVDLGQVLAGRPALLNIWAYWCGPCAEELPYLQQYAERVGEKIEVLTVHNDANEANGLTRLTDYGITLPGVQDGAGRVVAAVGAPNVLPVSVLISADGTVAKVLPQPFRSVDDIAEAVRVNLGIDS
ncbi:TlpA family protein disulfide reductase [Rhodococcus sp. ARC_M12]|uniref:TlpA family protein disulfide reductase n=1 Tax=unclassified Rhodococcus (in: high G+C Gram-positive bacteria) TaxID=192944 RepID=UPI001FB3D014|nr:MULTISPECIES: TlpA disulfide reductase family protein [unclassified Rhodococcus (in: high G+C Gram-positive bacteria)]MCJ0894615.1 TlpA family protein disulfide reductase [Rhodococcus sp. ARC_M5]MCJ0980392.1 TlpA family protein disulfide reductase [Rhodococcus sp. ARC_M12]